jgi:hypothetical protein
VKAMKNPRDAERIEMDYRSKRVDGDWQEPELLISQFAGESSLDSEGNIYFTHHFYKDGVMLEADYYIAYRK